VSHLSPVSTLFAALLGYDPVQHLIGAHALAQLPVAQQHILTGRSFFPGLIKGPFEDGLHAALDFAIVASLLAAWASWLRGGKYVYVEPEHARDAQAVDHGLNGSTPTADDSPASPLDPSPEPVRAQDDVTSAAVAQVDAG